jgi:hypothetical protein
VAEIGDVLQTALQRRGATRRSAALRSV